MTAPDLDQIKSALFDDGYQFYVDAISAVFGVTDRDEPEESSWRSIRSNPELNRHTMVQLRKFFHVVDLKEHGVLTKPKTMKQEIS